MSKIAASLMAACLLVCAGCSTPQPAPAVVLPSPPARLMEPAPDLERLPDSPEPIGLVETLTSVTRNYRAYHLVAERLRALQAWVREQAAVVP